MTQLIINGTRYPQASRDKYKCYEKELGESQRMINSRLITEIRAYITVIEYNYDYFGNQLMRQCLSDLRSRGDLDVQYLSPTGDTLRQGRFRCTVQPAPTFAFAVGGVPRWHNISFTLEEVEGHD